MRGNKEGEESNRISRAIYAFRTKAQTSILRTTRSRAIRARTHIVPEFSNFENRAAIDWSINIFGGKESGNPCFRFPMVLKQRDAHCPVAVLVLERTEAEPDIRCAPHIFGRREPKETSYI
jgi:hypothetical protein